MSVSSGTEHTLFGKVKDLLKEFDDYTDLNIPQNHPIVDGVIPGNLGPLKGAFFTMAGLAGRPPTGPEGDQRRRPVQRRLTSGIDGSRSMSDS